jgi:DNA-binding MarR family transcriptional regulator
MTPPAAVKTRTRAAPGLGRTLLLQSLARSGPATAKALAADLGMPYPSACQSLTGLEAASLAARGTGPASPGRGRTFLWEITPEGRSRLAGRAPRLADGCFSAILIEGRPVTAEDIAGWLQREGREGPVSVARVRDALNWLAEEPHAVVTRLRDQRRWDRTDLGRAVTALDEWDWAGIELCLQILRDRKSGEPGMSHAVAAGIFAWAGIATGTEDGDPAGRRPSWAAADEAGRREIGWEHDPASGQWTLAFRILRDGQWDVVREVMVPDISILAWQVREIAGTRNPEAEVVWMPGDAVEGSFWAIPQLAGHCAPELAGFRAEFAAG